MPIKATRTLLTAALDGTLNKSEMRIDDFFGFQVPLHVKNVDENILVPRNTWKNGESYDLQAKKLVQMFSENFSSFKDHVDNEILEAAPRIP